MNVRTTNRIGPIALASTIPLILMFFGTHAECAEPSEKGSDALLLEIMDLHSELVTNETFLAQAKMLGAYLETAQPLEESKRVKIYGKVLDILAKIKDSAAQIPTSPAKEQGVAEQEPLEAEKQEGRTVYEPGAAILEIFKPTSVAMAHEIIQSASGGDHLPVIRTYWKRDLACSTVFLLPERLDEVGEGSPYAGKFSFYYEAKQPGKYGFTIQHNENNACLLKIGGVTVVEPTQHDTGGRAWYGSGEKRIVPVYQGVCNLGEGFHRVEFWLVSRATSNRRSENAVFQAKILTPDTFDAVPITKDMMLLKADQKKAGEVDRGRRPKRKPLPYIDY